MKLNARIIIGTLAGIVMFLSIAVAVTGCGTSSSSSNSVSPTVVHSAQPASAQAVATAVNCDHFTDLGPGTALSTDTGVCDINGKSYHINTFATEDARNAWLKIAEAFGVVPKWETNNSVVYPS